MTQTQPTASHGTGRGGASSGPQAPGWFTRVTNRPVRSFVLLAAGVDIAVRSWGDPGRSPVVLVHGGRANAHWWDHIAPWLAVDRQVVAMDLSGHGDSAWRAPYSYETWAAEILAVARSVTSESLPIIVGHSMGGQASVVATAQAEGALAGTIIVDSGIHLGARPQKRLAWTPRIYPNEADALRAFRLVPSQGSELPWVVRYIARHSVRAVDGGWTWKIDPRYISRAEWVTTDTIKQARSPMTFLRAQYGVLARSDPAAVQAVISATCQVVDMPSVHHHIMMDRPLLLVHYLRRLIDSYDQSR